MDSEPIYTSEVTEFDHVYKGGITKKAKRFVGTIVGVVNGVTIAHKTEIVNRSFWEPLEKEKLFKRYYEEVEMRKKYSQTTL